MSDSILVKAAKKSARLSGALNEQEGKVYDILIEYLDTLPDGFFADHTLEELNKHFGGHDDMVVTENVRKALDAQQDLELIIDEIAGIYDDLPEEDEDDEE